MTVHQAPRFAIASDLGNYRVYRKKREERYHMYFMCFFEKILKKKYGCWEDGRSRFNVHILPAMFVLKVAAFYPKVPNHVRTVAVGMSHSLVLDNQRRLYGCGSDGVGQIGGTAAAVAQASAEFAGETATMAGLWPVPVFERLRVRISSVFAGREHTIVIDSRGRAYAFGRGTSGQLGLGNRCSRSLPCLIDDLKEPVACAALGDEHTIFLSVSGALYGCGCASMGQSGCGLYDVRYHVTGTNENGDAPGTNVAKDRYCLRPQRINSSRFVVTDGCGGDVCTGAARKIKDDERICAVASLKTKSIPPMGYLDAGPHHSLAVTHDGGKVYAWGCSFFGQLGLGGSGHVGVPTPVSFCIEEDGDEEGGKEEKNEVVVEMVAAGYSHSLALTSEGRVYSWGTGPKGQLGRGSEHVASYSPQLVPLPSCASIPVYVAAGYMTSFVLTVSGNVYEFGCTLRDIAVSCVVPTRVRFALRRQISDEEEEEEDLEDEDVTTEHSQRGDGIVAIAAAGDHALLLSSQGRLFAYGKGKSGELGAALSGTTFERPEAVRTVCDFT